VALDKCSIIHLNERKQKNIDLVKQMNRNAAQKQTNEDYFFSMLASYQLHREKCTISRRRFPDRKNLRLSGLGQEYKQHVRRNDDQPVHPAWCAHCGSKKNEVGRRTGEVNAMLALVAKL